jgi:hypothetical protein
MLSYIVYSIWFEEKRKKSVVERPEISLENGSLLKQTASLVLDQLFPKFYNRNNKASKKIRA